MIEFILSFIQTFSIINLDVLNIVLQDGGLILIASYIFKTGERISSLETKVDLFIKLHEERN